MAGEERRVDEDVRVGGGLGEAAERSTVDAENTWPMRPTSNPKARVAKMSAGVGCTISASTCSMKSSAVKAIWKLAEELVANVPTALACKAKVASSGMITSGFGPVTVKK